MAAAAASNVLLSSQAYLDGNVVKSTRSLVSHLCRQFYSLGWVSGTGGSITIKIHDDSILKPRQLIVMSSSGLQKERMMPEDMYVVSGVGTVLSATERKTYHIKARKYTDCASLFMKDMRNAGAVIHSHGMDPCLVTMIHPFSKEFRITHMEMIKGIQGHDYYDELVPKSENTAHEGELTEDLSEVIAAYQKMTAVLVLNHGIYIWGDSWISAKTQAEYHYLFDASINLHQLGIDWTSPSHGPVSNVKVHQGRVRHLNGSVLVSSVNGNYIAEPSRQCIVLDIEGTTTPISFVTDVLFPYARDNVRKHLMNTYDSKETKEDIELLRAQVKDDMENGVLGSVPIPPDDAGKEKVIDSVVTNVEAMIKADRKITALKQLQGHIWRTGFESNELQGVVFKDVPEALEKWHANGIKVYIYSSGSKEAQRLIFGNTSYGDLRKYLSGFFDTNVGNKREARSYFEISQSVGVDKPSQILFVTDVYQESVAAKAAGLQVIISVRPGNAPLPENHGFETIRSFAEI